MIILPAQLESYRSLKDRSVKVMFETGELSPSQAGDLQANILKAGFLAFKPDPFKEKEKELLDSLEAEYTDTSKTPSQRQRNYKFLLSWSDRVNRSATHQLDSIRTVMSNLRTERHYNRA